MPTLLLTRNQVSRMLDMSEVVQVIEENFAEWARGRVIMPPKSYLTLDNGDFRAMPASVPGAAGMKWVNVHPRNPARGLPTVMAVIVYNDPETGYPLAIMDGTDITAYRTGAASAVASKYLARSNSETLGLVGAGRQACTQLTAHAVIFKLKKIKVYDVDPVATDRLVKDFPDFDVKPSSLQDTVDSDIVCTLTPVREPIIMKEWVHPGTHINAVGADAPGKEELQPEILQEARIIVDDLKQSTTSGEINVPLSRGLLSPQRISGTLGEVVAGMKPGRETPGELTVFDATGLAFEDIACAAMVYRKARYHDEFARLNFVDG
jgi:alanine dehydrogenase